MSSLIESKHRGLEWDLMSWCGGWGVTMADRSDPEAVLITGVYGSGKTSVVEEIADVLERRGVPYAALDLDWLKWFDSGRGDDASEGVMLKNLDAVVGNYLDEGVRRFAIAGAYASLEEVETLTASLAMRVTVVRLTVALEEIERRLSSAVTAGRQDDLREAGEWIADGRGQSIEDLAIENDRPIREIALKVLSALGW